MRSRLLPWCRSWSRRAYFLHGLLIAQLILMPFPPNSHAVWIEVDTDGDGIMDSGYDDGNPPPGDPPPGDPPPSDPNADSDGDGLSDADEAAAGSDPNNPDSDGDGLSDAAESGTTGSDPNSSDSDGDGVSDYNEFYGNDSVDEDEDGPGETPYDHDGDGIPDPVDPDPTSPENDPDSDGDGVPDSEDSDPTNPGVWNDANGNGINDDAENSGYDIDGDGVSNDTDSHPSDPALYNDWNYNGVNDQDEDWDGDNVSNLQDSHPNSNVLWCDWNNNGINDDAEANLGDDDGDSVPNNADSHPFNSSLWEDWNNNGCNDSVEGNDADGDWTPDYLDSDPNDFNLWEDWNHNGTNDSQEYTNPDRDNDLMPNENDSDPDNGALWSDWNRNGINDDAEQPPQDDDGDGYPNNGDSDPGNMNLWDDWNRNGYNDSTEGNHLDDDNDGHPNSFDTHPQNPGLWNDANGNGINDEEETIITDTDGDGYADDLDSHPQDASLWNDHDSNGVNDELEAPPDTDGDGMPDQDDEFPFDRDNDGLSDTEEIAAGTLYDNADSDGDGLRDGEETYAGTNPLNVDTDGDGVTDYEELRGSFTDPLDPTDLVSSDPGGGGQGAGGQDPPSGLPPAPTGPEIEVQESLNGVVSSGYYIPDGATTAFPSKAVNTSDLVKTYTVRNAGDEPLTNLSFTLDGANKTDFITTPLGSSSLLPGVSTTFTVCLKTASANGVSRVARVLLKSNDVDEGTFDIHLKSVSGFWHNNFAYLHFFANLHDEDKDGLPDLVEMLYASPAWDDQTSRTFLPPNGDLDGDGKSNFEEYLAGTYLRGNVNTDYDQDGLDNTTEDNWSKVYPAYINKFRPDDAYKDHDADGLLTIEELACFWGPAKEAGAVATHPFNQSTGPNSSNGVTYNVTTRAHPLSSAPAYAWARRESIYYKTWMTDALLRQAVRDMIGSGQMPAIAFFASKYKYQLTPTMTGEVLGFDHLPAGYMMWLRAKGVVFDSDTDWPNGVLSAPSSTQAEKLAQLRAQYVTLGTDRDQDGLPDAWEIFHELDWRKRFPPTLQVAQNELDQRTAVPDPHGINYIYAAKGYMEYLGENDIIKEYPLTPPPKPAATAITTIIQVLEYHVKLATWQRWSTLNGMDPDHDGLSNHQELVLGSNPTLPDYAPTSDRDTDGDGISDGMEVLAGTNPHSSSSKPEFILSFTGGTGQTAPAHASLTNNLVVRALYDGPSRPMLPTGTPLPNTVIKIAAPDNYTLLAPVTSPAGSAEPAWKPLSNRIVTDEAGNASIAVRVPYKTSSSTKKGTVQLNAYAGSATSIKASTVINITALFVDTDGDGVRDANEDDDVDNDGLPDDWETANGLLKTSTNLNDSTPSPLHYGYHRDTPQGVIPVTATQNVDVELVGLYEAPGILREYSSTAKGTLTAKQWDILKKVDPDHDGRSNLDEYLDSQNGSVQFNPRIPDYPATGERDSDGDGFTNAMEVSHSTNHLDATDFPAYDLTIVSGDEQEVVATTLFAEPLVVLASLDGVPLKGVQIEITASKTDMRMADPEVSPLVWSANPKLCTGADGCARFAATAPGAAGSVEITCASVQLGLASVMFQAHIAPAGTNLAAAYQLKIFKGTPQTAYVGAYLEDALAIQVSRTTSYGMVLAVSGMPVTFTCSTGGAFMSKTGARIPSSYVETTGPTGYLSVRFEAPPTIGTHTITATIPTGQMQTFQITTLAIPGGGNPGSGPGTGTPESETQPNPEHVLSLQVPRMTVYISGTSRAKGVSYYLGTKVESAILPEGEVTSLVLLDGKSHHYVGDLGSVTKWSYIPAPRRDGANWGIYAALSSPPMADGFISYGSFPVWHSAESAIAEIGIASSSLIRLTGVTDGDEPTSETYIENSESRTKIRLISRAPGAPSNNDDPGITLPRGSRFTFVPEVTTTNLKNFEEEVAFLNPVHLEIPPGDWKSNAVYVEQIPGVSIPASPNMRVEVSLVPATIYGVAERDQKWNKVPNPKDPPFYENAIRLDPALIRRVLFVAVEPSTGKVELTVNTASGSTGSGKMMCGIRDNTSPDSAILPGSVAVSSGGETDISFTPTGNLKDNQMLAFRVVLGIDKNADGTLTSDEVVDNDAPLGDRVYVKAITQDDYEWALGKLHNYEWYVTYPTSQKFLRFFDGTNSTISGASLLSPLVVAITEKANPSHIAGSPYNPTNGETTIPRFKFSDGSSESNKIEDTFDRQDTVGLRATVYNAWNKNVAAISAPFAADPLLETSSFGPVTISPTEISFYESGIASDLQGSYGGASIEGIVSFVAKRDPVNPLKVILKSVTINAVVKDMYDFDWTRPSDSQSRKAAAVQIGWQPTARQSGKIFAHETEVQRLYDDDHAIWRFNNSYSIILPNPSSGPPIVPPKSNE